MWERLQLLLQQGKSILLTTHFMDEAERLCHRLLVLDHGRKIAEGRPARLIAEHLEPDVVEVYGQGRAGAGRRPGPARAGGAGGGQRRNRVFYTRGRPVPCWRHPGQPGSCARCTGRRTWKIFFSN